MQDAPAPVHGSAIDVALASARPRLEALDEFEQHATVRGVLVDAIGFVRR